MLLEKVDHLNFRNRNTYFLEFFTQIMQKISHESIYECKNEMMTINSKYGQQNQTALKKLKETILSAAQKRKNPESLQNFESTFETNNDPLQGFEYETAMKGYLESIKNNFLQKTEPIVKKIFKDTICQEIIDKSSMDIEQQADPISKPSVALKKRGRKRKNEFFNDLKAKEEEFEENPNENQGVRVVIKDEENKFGEIEISTKKKGKSKEEIVKKLKGNRQIIEKTEPEFDEDFIEEQNPKKRKNNEEFAEFLEKKSEIKSKNKKKIKEDNF